MDPDDLKSCWHECRQVDEPDWTAMERRLLDAFAARRQSAAAPPTARDTHTRWMPAAAAVMIAAALTFYTTPPRYPVPRPAEPAPAAASPPRDPGAAPAPAPSPRPDSTERPPRPAPKTPQVTARRNAAFEFVVLPGALALPDFESGRIVRVEVPLTLLPAYGIDLIPDAVPAHVTADVVVGQDGLPRAIRLADR